MKMLKTKKKMNNFLFTLWLLSWALYGCYEKYVNHHTSWGFMIVIILSVGIRRVIDEKY